MLLCLNLYIIIRINEHIPAEKYIYSITSELKSSNVSNNKNVENDMIQ